MLETWFRAYSCQQASYQPEFCKQWCGCAGSQCEGFSSEQLLVLFLQQPSHQVKMKEEDRGPSRGLVPCGRPSAEAKETVSITLRYHIKEKWFTCLYYKHFLFLVHTYRSAQSDQKLSFICASSLTRCCWMFGLIVAYFLVWRGTQKCCSAQIPNRPYRRCWAAADTRRFLRFPQSRLFPAVTGSTG